METRVIIERGTDGLYSCYMDNDSFDFALNGQGNSVEEAKNEFLLTYQELKEMYQEEEKVAPALKFQYEYDIPSFLSYYSKVLSLAGLHRLTGINQGQLSQYVSGYRKPGLKTVRKIETSLHEFAEEISQLHFV